MNVFIYLASLYVISVKTIFQKNPHFDSKGFFFLEYCNKIRTQSENGTEVGMKVGFSFYKIHIKQKIVCLFLPHLLYCS